MIKLLNSIFVIIGTIIGAGFASGKEIFTFFNIYGFWGFLGLIVSNILIGIVIFKVFSILIKYNISSYSDFVHKALPKSNFINSVVCNIINIFLFISFIVMVAGFSAYFSQEFNTSYIFGAVLICILSFFTFSQNINGIIKINLYFIPFLICIILLLGFKNLNCFTSLKYTSFSFNLSWLVNAILYASYNLIIVIPILITLKKYVNTLSNAKIVSLAVTAFLLIIAIIIFLLLNYYFTDIQNLELPTIYISSKLGNTYKYICGFAILIAIFTTAISSGYGFLCNLNLKSKKTYMLASGSICLVAIALSDIGFSTLLNLLYPILGGLGLIQIILILVFK